MKTLHLVCSHAEVESIATFARTTVERPLRPAPVKPGQYAHSPAPTYAEWREEFQCWYLLPADIEPADPSPATCYAYSCSLGKPGDQLVVKEEVCKTPFLDLACYAVDNKAVVEQGTWAHWPAGKHLSIAASRMPLSFSRYKLEVVAVKIEANPWRWIVEVKKV